MHRLCGIPVAHAQDIFGKARSGGPDLSTFPAWLSMGVYTPLVLLNKENYNFLNINDTYKRRTYFSKKVLVLFYVKANKIVTKLAYQCPFWV